MDANSIDTFCRVILMTTGDFVLILSILVGFVFLRKEAFGRALFIFAFSMILNPFLKSIFQVPPAPMADPAGWAFPSGHMQTASTFWIWLAWEYKNRIFFIFTALLLTLIGFALVYCGYHYVSDIFGALFFSVVTLIVYNLAIGNTYIKNNPYIIGFALAILGLPIMFLIPKVTKLLYVWVAFGTLVGFALGWLINDKICLGVKLSLKSKFIIFALAILGLVGIEYLFGLIQIKSFVIQAIHYFFVALWLSSIPQSIVCTILKNNQFSKKV